MAQKLNADSGNWSLTKTDTKGIEQSKQDTQDKSTIGESTKDKKTATSKATKKANKKTIRTLEGNLVVLPNENTIKITTRSTVKLKGLGKYLSGNYYVKSVQRSISNSGYSQSLTVIKTDFKKSLKVYAKYPDVKSKLKDFDSLYNKNLSNYKKKHSNAKPKKHIVGKKETLYTISKKYFNTTKYASVLASINGNLPKSKWTKLPVGYRLVIAKKK